MSDNAYMDNRVSKIEDNVYILHDKVEELSMIVNLQKTMIDDLFGMVSRTNGDIE
jgi:hypothetical protein